MRLGAESALHTVTVLHSIRDGANRTTELIQYISEAINSQNSSTAEFVTSLSQIDQQAMRLRDGLTNLSGISSSLKTLSGQLHEVSSSFKLGDGFERILVKA